MFRRSTLISILVVLLIVLLTACGENTNPTRQRGYGAYRERLFVQCMQLAKETVRAGHYNDSAEVISECGQHAYYLANRYRPEDHPEGRTDDGSQ